MAEKMKLLYITDFLIYVIIQSILVFLSYRNLSGILVGFLVYITILIGLRYMWYKLADLEFDYC